MGYLAYCGTDVEITPLQMAALISAIANGGTLYSLQYPRTPEELPAFQPVVRRKLDNLADYIPQIRDGLAGSVLYGTGRSAYDPDLIDIMARRERAAKTARAWAGSCPSRASSNPNMWRSCSCAEDA